MEGRQLQKSLTPSVGSDWVHRGLAQSTASPRKGEGSSALPLLLKYWILVDSERGYQSLSLCPLCWARHPRLWQVALVNVGGSPKKKNSHERDYWGDGKVDKGRREVGVKVDGSVGCQTTNLSTRERKQWGPAPWWDAEASWAQRRYTAWSTSLSFHWRSDSSSSL